MRVRTGVLPGAALFVVLCSHPPVLAVSVTPPTFPSSGAEGEKIAEAGQLLGNALRRTEPMAPAARTPEHARGTTVQEVSEGLTCQCGCGLTVANCNHPSCEFAVPVRTQIDGMLKTGMSRGQIIMTFRRTYGEKVLSAPTTEGFNILAWTMPFAALLAGTVLIVFVVGRWRSVSPGRGKTVPEPIATPEFDPRLKEILDRELRERI